MNNKYGYRLVDILKRGRGRKFPARPLPPRRGIGVRKGSKRIRDEGQGREPSSRYVSVHQLLEIVRPRITRAAYR